MVTSEVSAQIVLINLGMSQDVKHVLAAGIASVDSEAKLLKSIEELHYSEWSSIDHLTKDIKDPILLEKIRKIKLKKYRDEEYNNDNL